MDVVADDLARVGIRDQAQVNTSLAQWSNLVRLKTDSVPIRGFTWYSLIDQVDWNSALTEDAGKVNQYGLCDLERRVRPLGEAYRDLIRTWQPRVGNDFIFLR